MTGSLFSLSVVLIDRKALAFLPGLFCSLVVPHRRVRKSSKNFGVIVSRTINTQHLYYNTHIQ
jgi:hypothetical protein